MAVSLEKGQKISLDKTAGSSLTQITMGLGWDVAKSKGFFGFGGGSEEIDLDASCLMFDAQNQPLDAIWFAQLTSKDGSIRLTLATTARVQAMATTKASPSIWAVYLPLPKP